MEIREDEVDGVRVLWAESKEPLAGCLRFGVGKNDERLAQSGTSHVVEHLAIGPLQGDAFYRNGMVDAFSTSFVARGQPDEVVSFLGGVCRSLTSLPVERLADEVRILKVEAKGKKATQLSADLELRFGASGPGLLSWPELALNDLTPESVRDWAATWFVRQNAVVWLTGPLPPGLSLPLPNGATSPRLGPSRRTVMSRTWAGVDTDLVSVSMMVAAHPAFSVGAQIARQRIFERLRNQLAVSYDVALATYQVTPDESLAQIAADGKGDDAGVILGAMDEAISALADEGPTEAELDSVRTRRLRDLEQGDVAQPWLHLAAGRALYGQDVPDLDQRVEQLQSLTPQDVASAIECATATLVAIGPKSRGGALPGWNEEDRWSDATTVGTELTPDPRFQTGRLVIGDDAITWVANAAQRRTVRWTDLSAGLAWDDGTRVLVGADGLAVNVKPWAWTPDPAFGERTLTEVIDSHYDRRLRVPMGPGSGPPKDTAPSSAPAAPTPNRSSNPSTLSLRWELWLRKQRRSVLQRMLLGGMILLVVVAVLLSTVVGPLVAVVTIALTVGLTAAIRQRLRQRHH